MPSFHNHPSQFRSFKRPVSLNLGLEKRAGAPEANLESFELDSPGIDFGDESASLIDLIFTSASPNATAAATDSSTTDETENS
jgi:hypothetical protein